MFQKRVKYFSILIITIFSFTSCSSIKLNKVKNTQGKFLVKWSKNLDPKYEAGNLPISVGAPFIHADMVYQGSQIGTFNVYDIKDGRLIWTKFEGQPIDSQANIFEDQIVYGTKYGRLISRHYFTGELKWAIDLGESIESQAIFYKDRIFVHVRDHRIVCLDAYTGKIFWNYQRSIPFSTTLQKVSKVLPYKDQVIVGFADGQVVSLSIQEGLTLFETKINNGTRFIDADNSPVYFDGRIIASSYLSGINFLNANSGIIERNIPINSFHSPLIHEGEIIIGSIDGVVSRLNVDGEVIYKNEVTKDPISAIKIVNNKLALTTLLGEVIVLDRKTLIREAQYHLGSFTHSSVFSEIVAFNQNLAIYSSRNRLYVFKVE